MEISMLSEEIIEKLKFCLLAPARMGTPSLKAKGLLDIINEYTNFAPATWNNKDRIEYILSEVKPTCPTCNGPRKLNQIYCSSKCRANNPEVKKFTSNYQKANSKTRMEALKNTLFEKYGTTKVQEVPGAKEKTKFKRKFWCDETLKNTFKKYNLNLQQFSSFEYLSSVCGKLSYDELSEEVFNNMPKMTIYRFFERINYEHSPTTRGSVAQREILTFIESLGFKVKYNDRTIIKPLELDLVIEERKLAIEYNGMYFHRNRKDSIDKTTMAKNNGYTLLHIFEDEWTFKKDIWKSIIKYKLGVVESKIAARKCIIRPVTLNHANEFLLDNHLQGAVSNGKGIGLFYKDQLISILVYGKSRFKKDSYELFRFANKINTTVIGGFSKLLKHLKSLINEDIYTYADLRYSNGSLYSKHGTFIHQTDIGYFWIHKHNCLKRINRMSLQKHKLREILSDKFDEALSESENLEANGYVKLYDCGHLLYKL